MGKRVIHWPNNDCLYVICTLLLLALGRYSLSFIMPNRSFFSGPGLFGFSGVNTARNLLKVKLLPFQLVTDPAESMGY